MMFSTFIFCLRYYLATIFRRSINAHYTPQELVTSSHQVSLKSPFQYQNTRKNTLSKLTPTPLLLLVKTNPEITNFHLIIIHVRYYH